jgi:hypothetical protein
MQPYPGLVEHERGAGDIADLAGPGKVDGGLIQEA